jgi:hypothetical protein
MTLLYDCDEGLNVYPAFAGVTVPDQLYGTEAEYSPLEFVTGSPGNPLITTPLTPPPGLPTDPEIVYVIGVAV